MTTVKLQRTLQKTLKYIRLNKKCWTGYSSVMVIVEETKPFPDRFPSRFPQYIEYSVDVRVLNIVL